MQDKHTKPIVHENRYNYFLSNNEKAMKELSKAIDLYYELGVKQLKSKNLYMAKEAFGKVIQLSEDDLDWHKLIAVTYFDYEIYGEAQEELENLYLNYPDDLEIIGYLAEVYMELYEGEKTIPLLEKTLELRRSELTNEERKQLFDYIESLKKGLDE